MKTEPKRTETPWYVIGTIGGYTGIGHGSVAIARTLDSETLDNELVDSQVNAAFIVRAVNCHDEMLGTLKWILQYVGSDKNIQAACREVITKAEGSLK